MRTKLAAFKNTYSWTFAAGFLMVFLATALFLHLEHATSRRNNQNRVRVLQAVASLESCLTCHTTPGVNPTLAANGVFSVAYHPEIHLPEATTASTRAADSLKERVNTQLVNVGHQILSAPSPDSKTTEAAAQEFLRVYDQSRTEMDRDTLLGALKRLEALEQLLHQLEHQAQSGRWARADSSSIQNMQVMVQTAPSTSYSLAYAWPVTLDLARTFSPPRDELTVIMPAEVVLACHRRGPPAGASVESVFSWFGEKIAV
jgi:hypothetical protein